MSKPGLRMFVSHGELPRIINGLGVAIISTSHGLMTDKEARKQNLGESAFAIYTSEKTIKY